MQNLLSKYYEKSQTPAFQNLAAEDTEFLNVEWDDASMKSVQVVGVKAEKDGEFYYRYDIAIEYKKANDKVEHLEIQMAARNIFEAVNKFIVKLAQREGVELQSVEQ